MFTGRLIGSIHALLLSSLLVAIVGGNGHCPQAHGEDVIERKIRVKVAPLYPTVARRIGLTGVVKIEVTVTPNGAVKKTKVIGGHPILVNAAVDAVKKWKFETASSETTGVVEIHFSPTEQ